MKDFDDKGASSIKMDSATFNSYRTLAWGLFSFYYMVKKKQSISQKYM
jgi:hypothetical protein